MKLICFRDFRIDPTHDLGDVKDQEVYEQFLTLLKKRKSVEEARKIAISVMNEAEEQMLLHSYNGVPQYVEGFIGTKEENREENNVEKQKENREEHVPTDNANGTV